MKIKNFFFLFILSMLVITSCRDEFMPDINKYEHLLVVDGMITNDEGPYTVKLSLSAEVEQPAHIPYTSCQVEIVEKNGTREQLTEVEQGVYKTAQNGIRGMVGNEYKISIKTPDGRNFESEYQELQAPVEIDTIYTQLKTQQSNDHPYDLVGYQFYISTKSGVKPDNFILWQLEETYEFHSNFYIEYIFDGRMRPNGNRDSLYTCWKTKKINEFFVAETASLAGNHISDFPLHYVTTETKQLQELYSLLARQLVLNEQAYSYWKSLREQISEEDYLFSKQPYQIRGNIRNVDNPGEPVLGYFTVAGVDTKRIFVERPKDVEFHYMECYAETDLRALGYIPPSDYPIYLTIKDGGPALASVECFDCRYFGGILQKPDFWPN